MSFNVKPSGLDETTTITLDLDIIVGKDLTSSKTFSHDGASTAEYTTILPSGKNMRLIKGNGVYVATAMGTQYGSMENSNSQSALATNKVYYATDIATWTAVDLPYTLVIKDLKFLNGKFYIVGNIDYSYNDAYVLSSTDGITWTTVLSTLDPAILSLMSQDFGPSTVSKITYGDGKLVVAGWGNNYGMGHTRIYYSTDNGVTWNLSMPGYSYPNGVNYAWGAFAYGEGRFLLLDKGSAGQAYHSTDAVTWTQTGTGYGANDLVVHNGAFYAAHDYGVTQYRFTYDSMMNQTYIAQNRSYYDMMAMPNYPAFGNYLTLIGNSLYYSQFNGTTRKSVTLNLNVSDMSPGTADTWAAVSDLGSYAKVLLPDTGKFRKNLAALIKDLL